MVRRGSRSPSRRSVLVAVAALLVACLLLLSVARPGADAAISKKKEARAAKKAAAKAAAAAASSSSAAAASDQTVADDHPPAGEVLVTCGSALKLEHAATGRLLHSQNIAYGGEGSGQMGVTAVAAATDPGGVWLVKPVLLSPSSSSSASPDAAADGGDDALKLPSCQRGQSLKSGDRVRIQHARSRRWLHSHEFPSPISRQLEVSAFGGESQSDAMDEWLIELDPASNAKAGSSVFWKRDGKFSLRHVGTGGYLSSHERSFGHPIAGQNEVFGRKSGGKDFWKAGEGVFFESAATATATSKK